MSHQLVGGMTISGRYVLERQVGRGGMATVYQAFDPKLNLDVALKVLPRHLSHEPTFLARFHREGQTLAKLTHPNILRLFDLGEDDENGIYFLVLEYLTGGTLTGRLKGAPLTLDEVITLLRQIASGLDYAHHREPQVVHRDLKPANIMFADDGRVIISDFGLARMLAPIDAPPQSDSLLSLTMAQVIGTPAYMAPEQANGQQAGPAADLYAMGVLAYEMLVGKVPYQADTPLATLLQVVSNPLPLPTVANPSIDANVERILIKSLSKEPENRYSSGAEFVDALESAADSTRTVVLPRLPQRPPARAPAKLEDGLPGADARVVETGNSGGVAAVNRWQLPSSPLPPPAATPRQEQAPVSSTSARVDAPVPLPARKPVSVSPPIGEPRPVSPAAHIPVSPAQRKRILYLSVALLAAALVIVAMVAVGALNDSGPPSAAAVQPTAIAETLLVPTLALTPTLAVPTAVPTSPPPTQRPSPTSTPSSDDSWEALQPAISAAWGSDWPKTIALLDGFLQSDPAYAPARSKQHDALLLYANDLIANGKPSDGISQIQRALQFVGDSGSNAPEPGAADVWQALQPTLSGLWGTDWVGTTALLEAFLERFPNYPDAVTKLYDALVSEGQDLLGQGSTDPAVAVLEQARSLQPDRPEAGSVLAALTPAPTPAPVRVVQPQPTPRPAVRQPVPAPAQPAPAPAQPAPAPAQPAPVVRQPPAPAAPAPAPTKCAFGTPGCGG